MTKELKDKIRSKMDVSKFFAGFITLFIGLTFKEGDLNSLLLKFGILFIVVSLILCILSIFAYDHMLWPKKHWPRFQSEDQSNKEEYQRRLEEVMLHSWRSLFLPGVICFGIGMFLILLKRINLIGFFALGDLGKYQFWNWVLTTFFVAIFLLPIIFWKFMWPDFEKEEKSKK